MNTDSTGAQFIRGLVKFVFIGCYAAFMWASIHHVATFFNNFEQGSDTVGSFMLAGAFDITALVTTIGVMFFRKSMPTGIQVIVWFFIIAIAGYSFFINWEYAAHFQNSALVLQSTGETTPVFDTHGVLHYVPVMRQNTALLIVNPFLASGFTVFSLIYSIVAEFFGTKAPTIEEIRAKKAYLEEVSPELEEITKLENKNKKPGFIQRAKAAAIEVKEAAIEVVKKEQPETELTPEVQPKAIEPEPEIDEQFEVLGEEPEPEVEEDLVPSSSQIGLNLEKTSPRDSGELEAMPAPKPTLKLVPSSHQVQREAEDQPESNLASNSAPSSFQESASQAKRGAYYITMQSAEELTGYTAKFLRTKINKGEIATNPKGDKLKTSDVMKFIREKTSV